MLLILFNAFTLICVFSPSYQIDSWAVLESQCKRISAKVDKCWTEHSDIPDCTNEGEVVVCGQDETQRLRLCSREILNKAKTTVNNYKAIIDGLCDNKNMQSEFEKRSSCWYTARNCAMAFLNKTSNSDDLNTEECKKAIEEAEDCAEYDPWCSDLQTNLTLAAYENSECMDVYPEGQKLVSLAPILTATCNLELIAFSIYCFYYIM